MRDVAGSAPDLDRVLHSTLLGEALSSARIAALLADDRGHYVAVNDQACLLTGYTRSALVGFQAGQLAADERSRHIYENFVSGKKMQGRKLVRREDGQVIRCRYWAIPASVTSLPYYLLLLWRQAA
jgi:PAS domain S-box-containing protein